MGVYTLNSVSAKRGEVHLAILKEKNSPERDVAAEALGRLHAKSAIEPLIAILKDKEDKFGKYAAEILGRLGDKSAVEPLIAALKYKDSYLRNFKGPEILGPLTNI